MSQDVASPVTEAGDAVFKAGDYFLGIAQRTVSEGASAHVVLPGRGEVSLYPGRSEFAADIPDMAEFFQAPAAQFQITPLPATAAPAAPAVARNMSELLWAAAFHASQGRMVEGTSKYDVVQFRNWPNLTRLPKTHNTARICALLTRHPTTIMLVHRMLGIGKDEVYRAYCAAHSAGIASVVSRDPTAKDGQAEAAPAEPAGERTFLRSLFSKISGL